MFPHFAVFSVSPAVWSFLLGIGMGYGCSWWQFWLFQRRERWPFDEHGRRRP
jgi:hypothetical protein